MDPHGNGAASAGGRRGNGTGEGLARAVALFHHVRRFTYLSDGVRDPKIVAARRAGACTGKHLVLRELLREEGFSAGVETVEGDFAAGIPISETMGPDLQSMIAEAGVTDFHNIVRLDWHGRSMALDATWNDALIPYGFPVNDDWTGGGDTELALRPVRSHGIVEDVIAFKEESLARLSREDRIRRGRFLSLLSDWITSLKAPRSTPADGGSGANN
ncbi:hypothetical protein [Rhodobium gokarnense]|uniref:Transglutaminase-like domain-containing protein n=1 Tax=Rhodobium gokarnense TaxID=364296 RepID=A0ABT3H875_9HYPH|nr:hypothetical protein [Rhodobium gokarnense]MCW2306602.1 hypothetical protein [Rhodobium gokarnense]